MTVLEGEMARMGRLAWGACLVGGLCMGCGGGEPVEDMVSVPAGSYTLGPDNGSPEDGPAHAVTMSAYSIDRFEVTNREFKRFLAAEDCATYAVEGSPDPCVYEGPDNSSTIMDYWTNSAYLDFPVLNVRWDQADAYCRWAGKKLPTEAQWEVAARGADALLYPWGEEEPTCELANFEGCTPDATEGGSREAGASPFGAQDMAGNLAEWVADWYNPTFYQWGETTDPVGPVNGTTKVVRGGSWYCGPDKVTSTFRDHANPLYIYNSIGFRCAR